MKTAIIRTFLALGAITLAFGVTATPTLAAKKIKSIITEAKFISYDAETKTITVKVVTPGQRPKNKKLSLKRGNKVSFLIKPEGSVLKRTSVTLNGQRADISEIPEDQTLNIYWVPHDEEEDVRFARKIDMVLSDAELEKRDNERREAAEAAGQASDED